MEQRLGVLIATIDEKIDRVVRSSLPQLSKCDVVISHQITDDSAYAPGSFTGAHVSYVPVHSKGLAKNRNNSLTHAHSGINLFTDDDVEYIPDFEARILEAYTTHAGADIITFRVERGHSTDTSGKDHFTHDKWTIRAVPSIGITFKGDAIKQSGVTFDERFGIGATYISGEENIFLKDCLDAGLTLVHVDVPVVRHTHLSSAWTWDKAQVRSKVAVMWRMYGPLAAGIAPLRFVFTKKRLYQEYMNPITYLLTSYGAWFKILTQGL